MTKKYEHKEITRLSGFRPSTPSSTSIMQARYWQALPHSMAEQAPCLVSIAAFFFSAKTFRDKTSCFFAGQIFGADLPRGFLGINKEKGGSFRLPFLNSVFSSSGRCCIASFIAITLATGCNHVPSKKQITIKTGQGQESIQGSSGQLLFPKRNASIAESDIKGGKVGKTIIADVPALKPFPEPFRLSFIAVTPDVILRRIQEATSFEYVSPDEPLVNGAITLDVLLRTPKDVYAVVKAIADASGVSVRWVGNRAYFSQSVDGSTVSQQDGYLVVSGAVSPELSQLIIERYGVNCLPETSITICVGDKASITSIQKFLKTVRGSQGNVIWRLVNRDINPQILIEALNVGAFVRSSQVSAGRYLISSTESRFIDMIMSVSVHAQPDRCNVTTFEPINVTPQEVSAVLTSLVDGLCKEPVITSSSVVYGIREGNALEAQGLLMRLDVAAPIVQLTMYIATESAALRYGLEVSGVTLSLPQTITDGVVSLVGSIGDTAGLRIFEVVTDGLSTIDVSQTDFVQGDLIVTDGGSQVLGQDTRTVGLSASFDGVVNSTGYSGRFSITDSVLDDEITRSSSCTSFVKLTVNQVIKACQYSRVNATRRAAPIELSASEDDEIFKVYVSAKRHSIYELDKFSAALEPRS